MKCPCPRKRCPNMETHGELKGKCLLRNPYSCPEVTDKELVEKCLLTLRQRKGYVLFKFADDPIFDIDALLEAQITKAIPIIRKELEDAAFMRGWRKGNEIKQKRLDIKLKLAHKEVGEYLLTLETLEQFHQARMTLKFKGELPK